MVLLTSSNIPTVGGTQSYALPTNAIGAGSLHRAEYTYDGGVTVYPLEPRDMNEMDEFWIRRTQQSFRPSFIVATGYPPNWTAVLYPVPSSAGTLTVYYYRTPATANSDTDPLDLPSGWEDVAIVYAAYCAIRKDRDPSWQLLKTEYEEKLASMIDSTRRFHDQAGFVVQGSNNLPGWLVAADWDF